MKVVVNVRLVLVVALVVAVVTEIPFLLGSRWAPRGTVYDGLVGVTDDQNMYFSFIRQAAEGRWLFVDRLTHLDHQPVLLNLEWLAVGRLMAWLNGAQAWAYAIWRMAGIGMLVGGFWLLAGVVGLTQFQRNLALWMCAFGGGFGWIALALERGGLIPQFPAATLDLSNTIHPFSQMFAVPHLSVSHGLSLLFLATYIKGEETGRLYWYAFAAGLAVVHGLIRPYDLILIYGIIPLFIMAERALTGAWPLRTTLLRTLPLLATAPVVGYYVELFHYHPVFKHWASQGEVQSFSIPGHFFSFGVAGLLCLVRLCLLRRFPFRSSGERLLFIWVAAVLVLVHARDIPGLGFLPYSPIFRVTLPSTMLLLGACLLKPLENVWSNRPARGRMSLLVAFVAVNSLGSAVWVVKVCWNLKRFPDHYFAVAERDAFAWLNEHAQVSDVVLTTLPSGNRLARYASCRCVLGHWSVTPNVKHVSSQVKHFFANDLPGNEAAALLDEFHARWIYRGPHEKQLGSFDPQTLPGVSERFANDDVRIFSYVPR